MAMSSGGSSPEINVTPLVDVVLVLLIIFMVVTPLDERWLEVQVPQTSAGEGPTGAPPPVVTLDAHGVRVDEVPATRAELPQVLAKRMDRSKQVLFRAVGTVPYGELVAVMDDAKRAGATSLGWISEPPEQSAIGH